jgi:hypothetical protein
MRLRYVAGALALLIPFAVPSAAQEVDSTHKHNAVKVKLAGVVTNASDAPVANAEVNVLENGRIGRGVKTGADGWFELKDLDEGIVSIIVRRIGFQPRTMTFDVHQGAQEVVPITLATATTRLDTVIVTERAVRGRLAAYEERKAAGFGAFIDSTTFEKSPSGLVSNALLRVPGIRVEPPPPRRRGFVGSHYRVRMRGQYLGECVPALFVDGIRIYGTEVDEIAKPTNVAAIEIYTSVSSLPAQFMGSDSACGAIVIWLK